MKKYTYLLGFLFILLVFMIIYNQNNIESFEVSFGTPPETTSSDHEHIKGLLEIGSQAHENTIFDTVSTDYLGDIHRPTQPPPPPPPPDPICFTSPSSNSYHDNPTELESYSQNCCGSLNATYQGYDDIDNDD